MFEINYILFSGVGEKQQTPESGNETLFPLYFLYPLDQ